jgi:hypothetical protein
MIGLEVEAKKFFKIIETGDVSILGVDNCEQEFEQIYDLYYSSKKDGLMKTILTKRVNISALENEIETVAVACNYILNMPLTKEKRQSLINALSKQGYHIDKDKDVKTEIERIKRVKLGAKKNLLEREKAQLIEITKDKGTNNSFDDVMASFESVLDKSHIPDTITLGRFIAYEKQVKEKISRNNG